MIPEILVIEANLEINPPNDSRTHTNEAKQESKPQSPANVHQSLKQASVSSEVLIFVLFPLPAA